MPAIGGVDRKVARSADADEQRPGRLDPHHLALALELPWRRHPAGEAAAQTSVAEQIARMRGPAATVEISGRRGGGEALHARPDRHRDHVLLQPLIEADAGVAAGGDHVDETVFADDLKLDVGIGGEKRRHDRGKNQPHRDDRDVEPQRAGRPMMAISGVKLDEPDVRPAAARYDRDILLALDAIGHRRRIGGRIELSLPKELAGRRVISAEEAVQRPDEDQAACLSPATN